MKPIKFVPFGFAIYGQRFMDMKREFDANETWSDWSTAFNRGRTAAISPEYLNALHQMTDVLGDTLRSREFVTSS